MCAGWLFGKGVAVAVRYCIGCGQEVEHRAHFCSNCGTARPLPSRPKAKPAPTATPEAILASLEEVAQEQPEHPPTPEADVSVTPPPSVERSPRVGGMDPAVDRGPEPSYPERRSLAEWAGVLGTGLVFFVLSLALGVGVDASLFVGFVGFVAAALGSRGINRSKRLVGNIPDHTRHIPQGIKVQVAAREGARCGRCGSTENLQFDHLIPFSKGGSSTDANNIRLLCGRCNRLKSNRLKSNRYVG
jgi:ribosomal protein S27AE